MKMARTTKTFLLLFAPSVLFLAGWKVGYLSEMVLFFAIGVGIISYGYLVMEDNEFQGDKTKSLFPFAFACAGCTTIVKILVEAYSRHHLSGSSIAALCFWIAVIVFAVVKTPLFRKDK
jgi:hypothetical protein